MKASRKRNVASVSRKSRATAEDVFFGNEEHRETLLEAVRKGTPKSWNDWRRQHPRVIPDLRGLQLVGRSLVRFNLARARLDGAALVRADLGSAHLERASLKEARLMSAGLSAVHAEKVNLSGANLRGADLHYGNFRGVICSEATNLAHADLREANFAGAKMVATNLSRADLTKTCFDGANLKEANLSDAIFDQTSLLGTNLRSALVAGSFIRRVKTDDRTNQLGLCVDVHVAWDRPQGDMILFAEPNDIRVAQFHNIVDEHGSVGKLLAATTNRVVLILGRFLPQQKKVLDRLKEALERRGKIAVIFDFPSPEDREISDTVRFIAGMSEFIVVDLTKASSVPLELQATIPDLMIPVLPIVKSGEAVFAMFSDLQRRYSWIQPTVSYQDADELVKHVDDAIIARARNAAEQIRKRRAAAVRPPVSVVRAGQEARRRKTRH
jgi:hypothetical protein